MTPVGKNHFYDKCPNCDNMKRTHSKQCSECSKIKPTKVKKETLRKCVWPNKEELEKLVWEKPTREIAKDFGVSDNAVAKWCRKYRNLQTT